jgi:hypothetical protein
MASLPYGSATINNIANQRDARPYQEPIGASTVEVAGQNELLNGCIGTSAEQVIKASFASDLNYSQIALGTKGVGVDTGGVPVIGYWCQSASAAVAGATGLIDVNTWIWTAGAGTDTIMVDVAVGDRMWAGVLVP